MLMLRHLLPAVLAIVSCESATPSEPTVPSAAPAAAADPRPPTTPAPATPATPPPAGSVAVAHVEEVTGTLWRIDEAVLTEIALDAASGRVRCRVDGSGGCVVEELAADSVAHAVGLRHGDRLQRVAGIEITDAASLRAAVLAGRGLGMIDASIVRGGKPTRLRYRLRTSAPLRPADQQREKGLDVLGEALVTGADGAVVIDVAALPSLAAALRGRRAASALPRILGLGELRWTRITRDGETSTLTPVVASTLVDGVVEGLVGGREVTFGFEAEDGTGAREIRMTAREDVVEPTIITLAASLLDTPASASSLDPSSPEASAPEATAPETPVFEGITKISDHEFTITRATLDALLANPTALATAARIVPHPDGGMRLFGIRRTSTSFTWGHLGLVNGDRVLSINGVALEGPNEALDAYTTLRKLDEFRLGVVRRGTEFELVIRIVA